MPARLWQDVATLAGSGCMDMPHASICHTACDVVSTLGLLLATNHGCMLVLHRRKRRIMMPYQNWLANKSWMRIHHAPNLLLRMWPRGSLIWMIDRMLTCNRCLRLGYLF